MSCHVMSCHVMSCHVMSCHVMSRLTNLYPTKRGADFATADLNLLGETVSLLPDHMSASKLANSEINT